jgi:hypothetical protein
MTQINRTHQGVTTFPQPGCADTTRIYWEGVFIGRVVGQAVYDCTGRLRSGDDFAAFLLSAVTR